MQPRVPTTVINPRWSVEQRLAFIGRRLAWERRVNRADLVLRFGVSPNQATADIRRFVEMHPDAVAYDARGKTYRATADYGRPDAADAQALLRDLRLVGEGVLPVDETVLASLPAVAVVDTPSRPVPPAILRLVVDAIRAGGAIEGIYQSFSRPEPRRRRLEPHALVFDGFRWHARARDASEDIFKDFVLGRLVDAVPAGSATASPFADVEWREMVRLEIAPNPRLSSWQQAMVAQDYGMVGGRMTVECRRAVLYYVKRRLGLTDGHADRPPADQQIVLMGESGVA